MDDRQTLMELLEAFKKLNVLVIGDVMVDSYIYGRVKRISPEAPIPIVEVTKKEDCLGGAANVALNIQSLGANAHLYAVTGNDSYGATLLHLMEEKGLWAKGIYQSTHRRTTVKSRIISHAQHLVRFDEEDTHSPDATEKKALLERIKTKMSDYDVVIFEDYDKGCLNREVIREVIGLAKSHQIPTLVDPKKITSWIMWEPHYSNPTSKNLAKGWAGKLPRTTSRKPPPNCSELYNLSTH